MEVINSDNIEHVTYKLQTDQYHYLGIMVIMVTKEDLCYPGMAPLLEAQLHVDMINSYTF